MKQLFFLSIMVVLLSGCDKDSNDPNRLTVKLMYPDDPAVFKKSVVLYNQNDYLIKTPLDSFLIGYPFTLSGYDEMKTKAITDSQTNNLLDVSDYMKYNGDSIHTLAYYLEHGSCLVRNKVSDKLIPELQVETYLEGGPMTTTGGRRFYIDSKLFLETVDLMSK